jgi:predicted dienelactone hydrolase
MHYLKIIIVSLSFYILQTQSLAQTSYAIGKITPTWTDASRNNRSVPVEVYYPANTAGTNTPVASGIFPVLVIGHGFSMGVDAYYNFRDFFVPRGYIIVLVNTEIGPIPFPNHANFGADLNFAVNYMQQLNANSSSPFFGKVKNKSAVMGHSMGGGCSFLAAATGNPYITTLVGFAPAETNPSAISAASNISIPALMYYGTNDAVTPPANHVIPMYNNLQSTCKVMVSITNGSHCRFANNNATCNFGESTSCIGCSFITHAEHHARTFATLEPWLNFFLKEDCSQWSVFEQNLNNTPGTTHVRSCNYSLPTATATALGNTSFCPGDNVDIAGGNTGYTHYLWSNGATTININVSQSGAYSLIVTDQYNCSDTSNVVTVYVSNPEKPVLNITGNLNLCDGDFADVMITNFDNALLYQWSNGATTTNISIYQPGVYYVIATDSLGCVVSSDTLVVNILSKPQTPAIWQQNDTLYVAAANGILQWFYSGNPIPVNDTVYVPDTNGLYAVVVTDTNGCISDTAYYNYIISSVISINNNRWLIFPNPTYDILKITGMLPAKYSFSVFDATGRKMKVPVNYLNDTVLINMTTLPHSVYYICITSKDEKYIFRIIKSE